MFLVYFGCDRFVLNNLSWLKFSSYSRKSSSIQSIFAFSLGRKFDAKRKTGLYVMLNLGVLPQVYLNQYDPAHKNLKSNLQKMEVLF